MRKRKGFISCPEDVPGTGKRGLSLPPRPALAALLLVACCLASALPAGCSPPAGEYAREARSGYISARAVLAEVKEFPSSMEELLRSADLEELRTRGETLIEEARDLVSEAASALRTAQEKIERLRGVGEERFVAYAEALDSLVDLNLEVLARYAELIGLSGAALEGLPYKDNPAHLLPTLERMDELASRILELSSRIEAGEGEAEALFRSLEE